MTIEVFTRDVVPLIQLALTAIALISIFLIWWQIKLTRLWNQRQAEESYLRFSTMDIQAKLIAAAKRVRIDLKARLTPIDEAEAEKLWNDDQCYEALLKFLNDMETIAFAIRTGKVDLNEGLEMHGLLISLNFQKYYLHIKKVREKFKDDNIFLEIEKVTELWHNRQEKLKKLRERREKQ